MAVVYIAVFERHSRSFLPDELHQPEWSLQGQPIGDQVAVGLFDHLCAMVAVPYSMSNFGHGLFYHSAANPKFLRWRDHQTIHHATTGSVPCGGTFRIQD